jgi:subtilisin-like proprotein convertase family protein
MEHSYMGDLSMSITCPSNQQVMLKLFGAGPGGGGGGTILGEPVATNLPVDGSGGSLAGIPGIGYDYCFSMNSTSGYVTNPVNWTNVSPYTDPIGNLSTSPVINQANAGTYLPSGNYTSLIGCPLNGPWTLTVTDHLFLDDGFIFYWTINFLSSLYPSSELFTPEVLSYSWLNNSTVITNTGDSLIAVPTAPGSASYTFEVNDDFGCTFDTTLVFQVLSPTDPECLNCGNQLSQIPDTAICLNLSGVISDTFSVDVEIEDQIITMPFISALNTSIPGTPTAIASPLKIPISVSGVMPFSFSADNFVSVCLSIDHFFPTDLHLSLEAPNGTIILLKNTGTLSGAQGNISNACFTFDAATVFPNTNALAPFTGNWLPQQPNAWNNLLGVPVNGTWFLRIATPNFTFPGNVNWWNITFDAEVSYQYSWTPATGISCTDCPNPSFFPTETTIYTIELLNNYGCIETQSFTMGIGEFYPAPVLQCGLPSPTQVTAFWMPYRETM